MNIECKNINDLCELIDIAIGQGLENLFVFVSAKPSYPNVVVATSPKNYKKFNYTLFTPLYTVIYQGNIKADIAAKDFDLLKERCDKYEIHIHTFDQLNYRSDSNSLSLETHIDVI